MRSQAGVVVARKSTKSKTLSLFKDIVTSMHISDFFLLKEAVDWKYKRDLIFIRRKKREYLEALKVKRSIK